MLRRLLLLTSPAMLLAACTTTKNGSATTVTIDTQKVDRDGTAILQALNSMLGAPSIAVLLGPDLVIAQTAIAAAEASLKEFDSVTGGSMSATYDPTKAQATILSFISNAQQVVTVVQQAMPKISASNVLTSIGNYAAAVQALFSFLQIAIGLSSVSVSVPPKMTEAQALKLATH
jgi:hypothetical protein